MADKETILEPKIKYIGKYEFLRCARCDERLWDEKESQIEGFRYCPCCGQKFRENDED